MLLGIYVTLLTQKNPGKNFPGFLKPQCDF